MKPMWCLSTALAFVRELETSLARVGWHVALGGGVLRSGKSTHDLDVIAYPHCKPAKDVGALGRALHRAGLKPYASATKLRKGWRIKGSRDTKHVEVWMNGARRVDVIVVS